MSSFAFVCNCLSPASCRDDSMRKKETENQLSQQSRFYNTKKSRRES